MASKQSAKGKSKKGGGDTQDDVKREQKLQAILMADSFEKSFRPITWERPKVLLPLVNVPMLEYTVEFLSQNGVEEIFLVCVWHAKQLQHYVDNISKWPKSVTVHCMAMPSCLSAGDALRELDSLGLIRSDPFVLISGDVISNMNVKKAIEFHKARRQQDHNCIMTTVLKPVQRGAGSKPVLDDLVVGMDKQSGQIILFNDTYKKKSTAIPLEILADHPSLVIRTDLLDCHVDICSPELMLQFSDNFDYQDIRKDFIRNEVVNWELGMHVYGYILNNLPPYAAHEYAARVQDLRTYHSICRDIVTRWVYPFVPDAYLLSDSSFELMRGKRNVYREKGVFIARSATIGEGVVLGRGANVGENTSVSRTILGRDCKVGANSKVVESHIWEGAILEAGVHICQALVCENVVVKKGARIGRGCVLSKGVVIGQNVVLPDFTSVSLHQRSQEEGANFSDGDGEDSDSDGWVGGDGMAAAKPAVDKDAPYHHHALGADGKGYVWSPVDKNPDDAQRDADNSDSSEDEDEDDEDDETGMSIPFDERISQQMGCVEEEKKRKLLWRVLPKPDDTDDSEDEFSLDGVEAEEEEMKNFMRMVGEMVVTGRNESHSADNLLMEIKGLKFAQNKTFADCLRGMTPELVLVPKRDSARSRSGASTAADVDLPAMVVIKQVKVLFSAGAGGWSHNMMKPMIQDEDDERAVIESVESVCIDPLHTNTYYSIFRMILQVLFESELVSEDALIDFFDDRMTEHKEGALEGKCLRGDKGEESEESGGEGNKNKDGLGPMRAKLLMETSTQDFIEWLKEEEEDDDESSEEED